jgi:hypothetical protein
VGSLEDDSMNIISLGWLLLADIYINQGKNEQATNVLRTVLQHNASSSKAWGQGFLVTSNHIPINIRSYEYMGFICEKVNFVPNKLVMNRFRSKNILTLPPTTKQRGMFASDGTRELVIINYAHFLIYKYIAMNPGYKLAYNYFKCRRLFDCIEVGAIS